MKQPMIDLKAIKYFSSMSEETPAYQAKLYVDGKHIANVSNHGQGGCDTVNRVNGFSYDDLTALEARIAATFPIHDMSQYGVDDLKESLEGLCHTIVIETSEKKRFKALLGRKILITRDGKVFDVKGKKSDALLKAVIAKYGEANTLNAMSFKDAWNIFKNIA